MKKIKLFITTALIALCGMTAFAQDNCGDEATCPKHEAGELGYWPQPYNFVQVQGGLGTTFTSGPNFLDLCTPTFSLGVGRMFTPVVGARLHFNGYESKSKLNSIDKDYTYKYLTSDFDVLVNVTNIFRNTRKNFFNLYFIGGVGLNYAWDNDEFQDLTKAYGPQIREDVTNAWGEGTNRKSLFDHNIRAGLLFDFDVAKHWSLGLEADINNMGDRFNSKYNDNDDWMLTAQLTATYKFGFKKAEKCEKPAPAPAPAPAPVVKPEPKPAPAPVVEKPAPKPEPKPAPAPVVKKERPLKEVIFYTIRASEPQDAILQKVIDWCNEYPDKYVTVDGYADKGTGTPKLNVGYAKARAEKVAKALRDKGLAANRIKVQSYGDTVQPYDENDKNRCVIIVGK